VTGRGNGSFREIDLLKRDHSVRETLRASRPLVGNRVKNSVRDEIVRAAVGFDVFTARHLPGFAAVFASHRLIFKMNPRAQAGGQVRRFCPMAWSGNSNARGYIDNLVTAAKLGSEQLKGRCNCTHAHESNYILHVFHSLRFFNGLIPKIGNPSCHRHRVGT
jgi:hypothetical protein